MADSSESERENYNISSSTDEEDLFGTIGRRFQPYQDEPLASSDSEGDGPTSDGNDDPEDEDGIRPSQFRDREAGSVSVDHWCECGKCSSEHLVSAREYRCCKEVSGAYEKVVAEGIQDATQCITCHPDYQAMTNKTVLLQVGPMFKGRDGKPYRRRPGVSEEEYIRAIAYRWIIKWLYGYLGWDNSRPLCACVYNHIRGLYQVGQNKGYKDSAERQ